MGLATITRAQLVQVISLNVPPNSLSCSNTNISVMTQLGCINMIFDSTSFTITGNTINVGVYYTDPGICLPAISNVNHSINLGMLPANNYNVVATAYTNLMFPSSMSDSLNVISCCNAAPGISSSATSICPGDTVSFVNTSTNDSAHVWFVDNTLIGSPDSFEYVFNSPGTFDVKLIVYGTGCADSTTQTITVNTPPNVSLGPDTAFCAGSSVVLDAGSGWSNILWSTGAGTQMINVTMPGDYVVTVWDGNGCMNSDTVNVAQNAIPIVNLGNDTVLCEGNPVVLDATVAGPASYQWNTGDTTATLNITQSGGYAVTVSVPGGCSAYDSAFVLFTLAPNINLGVDDTVCLGSSVTLDATTSGASAYLWSDGSTGPTVTFIMAGDISYHVAVTGSNGCIGYDTINLFETICIGLKDQLAEGIQIHPNPTYSSLNIDFEIGTQKPLEVVVIGIDGKTYLSGRIEKGTRKEIIDLTQLKTGTYLLRITDGSETLTQKIIKR